MTWNITRYEPPDLIQFSVINAKSHLWNLLIELEPSNPGYTTLVWKHTFTSLTEIGNQYLREYSDEKHRTQMNRIEKCMTYFMQNGEMIRE